MTSKIKDRLSFKLACIDLIIHLLSNFTRATHYLTLATHSQTMRKSTHTHAIITKRFKLLSSAANL